ncbi:hypothetical protein, partial [uncultured Duncaniella sp.]|uniref:hypothetical protein n=1 Tax=uncultured Duncaniella sp. TaxID=2768039 RepID=UPI00260CDC28
CRTWNMARKLKIMENESIEECSDGRCLLNRAKYDKNRKIRNEILWQTSLIPALIGAALAIILIKLGIR